MRQLLAAPLTWSAPPYWDSMRRASPRIQSSDECGAAGLLRGFAVRVCAAAVSNRHPVIQQLLAGTPWYDQLEEMSELAAPPAPKKAKVGHTASTTSTNRTHRALRHQQ